MTTERTPERGGYSAQQNEPKASPAPTDVGGLPYLLESICRSHDARTGDEDGWALDDCDLRDIRKAAALLETQASALAEKDAALKEAGEREADMRQILADMMRGVQGARAAARSVLSTISGAGK